MASEPKDTIIVRVKRHTKWAARRAAKAENVTLTKYIIDLIHADAAERSGVDGRKFPKQESDQAVA
jgi:uncharacterized protein (DUF1778 family)